MDLDNVADADHPDVCPLEAAECLLAVQFGDAAKAALIMQFRLYH